MIGGGFLLSPLQNPHQPTLCSEMFVKAFLLLVGLSAAYSLRCYTCIGKNSDCSKIADCSSVPSADRCAVSEVDGVVAKGCVPQALCTGSVSCCEKDLCNGSASTGPAVVLLLLSSSIFTLFL